MALIIFIVTEELEDLNLDDPELEQAATKIQAAFRGHRTRQSTKKMAEEEQIDIDLNDPGKTIPLYISHH